MFVQASLAVAWIYIHATARLACTNVPMPYTVYGFDVVCTRASYCNKYINQRDAQDISQECVHFVGLYTPYSL